MGSEMCIRDRRGVDATVNFATAAPLGVKRNSGSLTKLPIMVRLVSPAAILFSPLSTLDACYLFLGIYSGRTTLVRRTDSFKLS